MTTEIKEKGLAAFLKNPYWKGIYEGASEKCKRYYEINFAASERLMSSEEHKAEVIEVYKTLDPADWEYLISHTQNNMGKWGFKNAREKYGKKE